MEPRYTVAEIIRTLNAQRNGNWVEIPGIYFLSEATLDQIRGLNVQNTNGIVLKGFINETTGEVKTYLAKWLNVPEGPALR